MDRFRPPDDLVLFSHRFWEKTGWYIPPVCWLLLAFIVLLAALLSLSIGIRLWTRTRD